MNGGNGRGSSIYGYLKSHFFDKVERKFFQPELSILESSFLCKELKQWTEQWSVKNWYP